MIIIMKSINRDETLWNKITVEILEDRAEYTSLTPGCCFQVGGSCCINVNGPCCFEM